MKTENENDRTEYPVTIGCGKRKVKQVDFESLSNETVSPDWMLGI